MRGKGKTTIYTISKELGVSPSTVSRAFDPNSRISDETREAVLKLAKEKHYEPNIAASRLSASAFNIGIIASNNYLPAVDEYIRGFQSSYKSHSDMKLNLEYRVIGDTSAEDSLFGALEDFKGFDAVIASGFVDDSSRQLFSEYADQGGQLVFLQCDIDGPKKMFSSYHDFGVACKISAEFIHDCLRISGGKRTVLITDSRTMSNQLLTAKAFEEAAKTFGLEIIGSYDMDGSSKKLLSITKEIFANGQKPDAIYITSGKSGSLIRYMEENGYCDNTVLVTFDVNDDVIDGLENGTVWATVNQSYYNQAKKALSKLIGCLVGTDEPTDTVTIPELMFRSNVVKK